MMSGQLNDRRQVFPDVMSRILYSSEVIPC